MLFGVAQMKPAAAAAVTLLLATLLPLTSAEGGCPYSHEHGTGAIIHSKPPPGFTKRDDKVRLPGDDGYLDKFYVDDSDVYTTTDFGTPVSDRVSLKAGERGPTLLEDFVLRTKITRFDHERVPERAGEYLQTYRSECGWG